MVDQTLDAHIWNEIGLLERLWKEKSFGALPEIIKGCDNLKVPLPPFALGPVLHCILFTLDNEKFGGRSGNHAALAREKSMHRLRYWMVGLLRSEINPKTGKPVSLAAACESVSEALRKGDARGSPLAVKNSHRLVKKAIKAGHGAEFGIVGENGTGNSPN